jgi:hypothetical protein
LTVSIWQSEHTGYQSSQRHGSKAVLS